MINLSFKKLDKLNKIDLIGQNKIRQNKLNIINLICLNLASQIIKNKII